jgi:hypothetical protein
MQLTTRRFPWQLSRLDGLLQAALLLRLSEQGHARDLDYDLVEKLDADGVKIDAFSLGVFDKLIHAHLAGPDALPVLLYLLKLDERGPGSDTVDAAERALASGDRTALKRYVELGRETAVRALAGGTPCPGGYAELLLDELTAR